MVNRLLSVRSCDPGSPVGKRSRPILQPGKQESAPFPCPPFLPRNLKSPIRIMADLTGAKRLLWIPRMALFMSMLYVFLGAIKLLEVAFGVFGAGAVEQLFQGLSNPFAGLAVGILATALIQSSSATTSMVVVFVGTGDLPLDAAVPVVMGANIGTSVTCVLVSLGHVTEMLPFAVLSPVLRFTTCSTC